MRLHVANGKEVNKLLAIVERLLYCPGRVHLSRATFNAAWKLDRALGKYLTWHYEKTKTKA